MCEGGERRLERRRRQEDSAVEAVAVETPERLGVGGAGVVVLPHRFVVEEERPHRADALDAARGVEGGDHLVEP